MNGPTLLDPLVVHCFYGCPFTVSGFEPQSNHDAMEAHYRHDHYGKPVKRRKGEPESLVMVTTRYQCGECGERWSITHESRVLRWSASIEWKQTHNGGRCWQ